MTKTDAKTYVDFVLPPSVVSKIDLSRLVSELEQVDDELTQATARHKVGSHHKAAAPVLSDQLINFLEKNKLDLDTARERDGLIKQLRLLKDKVPVVHMTFAVSADHDSLETLAAWLRKSTHPQTVIEVGLQPGLVGGVYLRTPNHVHDFSLRAALAGHHDELVKELEALHGGK